MKALSAECPTKANRRLQGYKIVFEILLQLLGATSSHKRIGERGDREIDKIDDKCQQANNIERLFLVTVKIWE